MYRIKVDNEKVICIYNNIDVIEIETENTSFIENSNFIRNFLEDGFVDYSLNDLEDSLEFHFMRNICINFPNGLKYKKKDIWNSSLSFNYKDKEFKQYKQSNLYSITLEFLLTMSADWVFSVADYWSFLDVVSTKNNLCHIGVAGIKIYAYESVFRILQSPVYLEAVDYFNTGDLFKPNSKLARAITLKKDIFIAYVDNDFNLKILMG